LAPPVSPAALRMPPVLAEPVAPSHPTPERSVRIPAAPPAVPPNEPKSRARSHWPARRAMRPPESGTAGSIDLPAIRSGEDLTSNISSPSRNPAFSSTIRLTSPDGSAEAPTNLQWRGPRYPGLSLWINYGCPVSGRLGSLAMLLGAHQQSHVRMTIRLPAKSHRQHIALG
jgi:hypothetical protein